MKCHLSENNSWAHGDMNFLFESSTQNIASGCSEGVRCRIEHEKGNYMSPSNHVLYRLLYKHLVHKKKPT